jgi:hypothetical protein|tara:strand:- start:203 stop:346 length:144 start_codon:yes stop_codon:yes gene_type:complete
MSRLDKRIVALLKIEMFTKSGLEYSDLSKEEILKEINQLINEAYESN